ncbi:hypothetical protein FQR65_LT12722 [Abscondita terminalis]|nr:hypothetical protein FQR65_LT12722 [Abscondita terminalis]
MLAGSVLIGMYFGWCKKKQNTVNEYLKGGKNMKAIPIALSLIASTIASNILLAAPVDVYRFGANYIWISVATLIECFVGYHIFLKVFFKLQVTNVFEYLQLRFDNKLRILVSVLNIFGMFILCPMVTYVPSLAFSQVTGVNVILIAIITSSLCIFYTTIGGFKTVVWSDILQFFIIVISFLIMFCVGMSAINGFDVLWNTSIKSHRLDIFDFDPTIRDSFSSVLIGGTFFWLGNTCIHPGSVQKYLSVPTLADVKKVITIFAVVVAVIHTFVAFTGLLMYTRYSTCDPILAKEISSLDQLVPYFVMDVAGKLVGYPGIFVAGVFSAGLSTLSACLNTMSAVIYEDFVSLFVSKTISQKQIGRILRLIVILTGTVSTLLVFVLQYVNGIFPVFTSIYSAILGPILGLYFMGVLIPIANSKGAFCGGVVGVSFISFVFIQHLRYPIDDLFLKPFSTDGCNSTIHQNTTSKEIDLPFALYRISFWLNTLMGATVTVVVGVIIICCIHGLDQLVPYFVMDVAGKLVGYPGIFVAGVFSAGLRVITIFAVVVAVIHTFVAFTGLLMYTRYSTCDPILAKEISSLDQLVPYFVMDVAGKLVGYPGIFVAGVFSAGLSTLSACLNTMSAVIYEDVVSLFVSKTISQKQIGRILRLIVILTGTVSTLLVFVLQNVNGIFPVFTSIYSAILGPILGLYFMGVLIPIANSKGAFCGGVVGVSFISFVFIQHLRYPIDDLFLKPFSTDGCNSTIHQNTTSKEIDLPFALYRISFWLNTLMGATVTVVVGVIISCFTKHDKAPISKNLLTPWIHSIVKKPLPEDDSELVHLQSQ